MIKFFSLPKKIILIISPNNFTLLEINKKNFKIIKKIEKDNNYFYDSSLIKENVNEFLKIIKENYKNEQINVILNIPKFFIQKFNLPNLEKFKERNIIENKIKEEIPINIERYFWKVYFNPNIYENTLILFYEKEILEDITNQLLLKGFLPVELQPIFSLIISFIKQKYALAFDKSYIFLILFKNVITLIAYENGFITNVFSEQIESTNQKETIERIINYSLRLLISPLDIVFILADQEVEINFLNKTKIINVTKEIELSLTEIISMSIFDQHNKDLLSEFDLNIYNLEKEISIYNFNNLIKLWITVSLILGILINISLFFGFNYLNKWKSKLMNEISSIKSESLEEAKDILINLKNKTSTLKIYRNLEMLNYLKNYKIINFEFNINSAEIIIEETDPKKKEEILNYLKNNLKLNNIKEENNLISIKLNYE